jgi:two-component system sensor histidine kinase BarA
LDQNPVKARLARLPARDAEAALATAGGDADLAAELFSALLTGLPGELDDLRGRLAESDWPGLAEHAHQLLGATRYCGVPALDEAAGALERAARIGAPDMIAAAFTNLEAEIERVRQATD